MQDKVIVKAPILYNGKTKVRIYSEVHQICETFINGKKSEKSTVILFLKHLFQIHQPNVNLTFMQKNDFFNLLNSWKKNHAH